MMLLCLGCITLWVKDSFGDGRFYIEDCIYLGQSLEHTSGFLIKTLRPRYVPMYCKMLTAP